MPNKSGNLGSEKSAIENLIAKKQYELNQAEKYTDKIDEKQKKKLISDLNALDKRQKLDNNAEIYEQQKKDAKELADSKMKAALAEGKVIKAAAEEVKYALTDGLTDTVSSIQKQLDGIIDNYINKQQSISAHLVGTGYTLGSITDTLNNALSTQGLVKQESVYNNLYKLVNQGIVYNVEQRAFLQTLSDDMNLLFDSTNGSLLRLIRLQGTDLTSYRMAIQYNLQEFLNENYKTSEYIKDAFTSVSESLIETQSLLTSSQSVELESTLQTILGSYYSLGASSSTVTNLASAINALGSGDISSLGSGISNLILMGVAQAGLDYGSLLNNGITAEQTSAIMNSVIEYMSTMYSQNDSNIVRNQLAKTFGVSVSDLVAAYRTPTVTGMVSSDITEALDEFDSFVPLTTKLSNLLDNMWYSWGTNIASSPLAYITYEAEELIADTLGSALSGVTVGGINLGSVAKAAPILTLLPTLIETVGQAYSSFSTLSDTGLAGLYAALSGEGTTQIKISDAGVSAEMYLGAGNTTDILNNSVSNVSDVTAGVETTTSEKDETWPDDIALIRDMFDTLNGYMFEIKGNIDDIREVLV